MSRCRIAWNLLATIYDKAAIAGVQLAVVPLLALHWGVHLYGCWVMMAAAPSFLALSDFGFGGAAMVRMTALIAADERAAAAVTYRTADQVVTGAAAVVAALAIAAAWIVPAGWLPRDPVLDAAAARTTLTLLILYAGVALQGSLPAAAAASARLFASFHAGHATVIVAENALLAIAVVAGAGPVGAAAGLLAGRLAGRTIQQLWLRRRVPWLVRTAARAEAGERRVLARAAASVLAVPLGQATALQGSVLVLGAAAGAAATPAFVAARTLSRIALQLTQLLTHAIQPEFTAAHTRGDARGQAAMLLAVVGTALAGTLPFALLIGTAGGRLMRWWTGGVVVSTPGLMPVIAVSVLLGGLWQPLSTLMFATGRQAAYAWPYLGLAALSLGATWLLAPALGATGAAAALAGLDACMAALVARFAWRYWLRGLPTAAVARAGWARARALVAR